MTSIDYRIAVRRHTVREAASRRRLGHLLILIGFSVIVGLTAQLFQSPAMAIRDINVVGAHRADIDTLLERHNVVPGVPTISVRPAEIAADAEADPWVARAQATITWPGTVELVVLEHEPIAWVRIHGDWYQASADGAVLAAAAPAEGGARVEFDGLSAELGGRLKGRRVRAALEFLGALPEELRRDAVVTSGGKGILAARISGHRIDLGSPGDMKQKAAALTAILAGGVPKKSQISLVSPSRPALSNPQQVVEG